ncbi:ABC transporter substrate-binding protein [Aureimonas jatrophae]|uniref:Peptide/nickel transport system substrate-binding protein n=1 Tax=Aureimonas jatrophae TaxID=1166073 RepID=A0A1H0KUB5_9HYPH|nr:ABC transporter substrate-binding protein [Aureimonas jatrophae]MBB3948879.1 peptide/nickel transport system substrate-binding protein [Aureimonas jatrophae]SDO59557.1 peptide/nickel transport system substrate-binding protein [Aureimonas jatrophae]
MTKWFSGTAIAVLWTMALSGAAGAQELKGPEPAPVGQSLQKGEGVRIARDTLMQARALDSYQEPGWVADMVKAGKLPPVKDRLPAVPLVVDTSSVEGPGVYGGVLRHVSGARPQGWNWAAGNVLAWGGVEEIISQCLVRNAPVWMLTPENTEPLPQLATRWEWSEDGHALTMHLLKGAKWSDGQPFTADDVVFHWEDNMNDPGVAAWGRPAAYGEGTKLEKVDDATIRWVFTEAFPVTTLYQMGYQKMCPGPAHILKPLHPKYNKDATYQSYATALSPDKTPWVTMGPWTVTDYRPNQIMVMRRNPYFYEVDDKGNQLPYLDEVQYKLSTWEDRTIQTVAGSADYANLEDPSLYLESMRQAQKPDFPTKVIWGPRSIDWSVLPNYSTVCGVASDRDRAIRELNRNAEFRRIVSQGIDRQALGQSLVRGPFIIPFAGGLHPESDFGSPDMTVFYPYDLAGAKAALARMGFTDTDGDGIVNWPADKAAMGGRNLDINLAYSTLYPTDTSIAQSLVTMLREVGVNAVLQPNNTELVNLIDGCAWDWVVRRGDRYSQAPIMNLDYLAPVAANRPEWHRGTPEKPQELLPFETELVSLVRQIQREPDAGKRNALLRDFNRLQTENVYQIGLVSVPAALLIGKRLHNVPAGTPVLAYGWGEDGAMRERLFVPADQQGSVPELAPRTLPGVQ